MNDYVDVRGVWPIYVCGIWAVQLRNQPRDLTLEKARELAKHAQAELKHQQDKSRGKA